MGRGVGKGMRHEESEREDDDDGLDIRMFAALEIS